MNTKFKIEEISPGDEAAVRAFLVKAIARPGAGANLPEGWLAWLRKGAECAGLVDVPVGWKLTVEGEIGGVHLVVPFRVAAATGEAVTLQSAGFYVDPHWHGPASGALFLALMKFRSRFHCSVGTANEASAKVWKAFKATELAGSGGEWCQMRLSTALVEEALVRRWRWLSKLLPAGSHTVRASLPQRLIELRRILGGAVIGEGREAAAVCSAFPYSGAGAIPTAALLEWKLSAPDARGALLALDFEGRPVAVYLTAGTRGHRGQTPALSISAVWGPAWDAAPALVSGAILRAAKKVFPLVSLGFGPVPDPVRQMLRNRALDAPRRWVATSAAQPPPLSGWNGLDAL